GAVAGVPALQGAQPDTGVPGQGGERDLVLDVKPEDLPAPGRVHDLHVASRLSWFDRWDTLAVERAVDGGAADAQDRTDLRHRHLILLIHPTGRLDLVRRQCGRSPAFPATGPGGGQSCVGALT